MSCNQCVQPLVQLGAWFMRKEVDSAAAVGLCCTHNTPCSTLSSGFPISQGNAEALDRWGGKTKHHMIPYFLGNISAKHYRNRIVYAKTIASQRWNVFWDTVYIDQICMCVRIGTPVNRIPIMAKQTLDLYELFRLVVSKGGLVEVINKKLWREITKGLNLPSSITSAAFTLRTQSVQHSSPSTRTLHSRI